MHAIERVRIVVQLKDGLPEKSVRKLVGDASDVAMSAGLTVKSELTPFSLSNNVDGPAVVSSPVSGWMYSREGSAGARAEALIIEPELILFESTDYLRWAGFWARAQELLKSSIEGASQVTDFKAFMLEYFDRFVFDGDKSVAEPSKIIKAPYAELLPVPAKAGRELWHLHRGWFDTRKDLRVLINQNLDAQDGRDPSGKEFRSIAVYTKIERRADSKTLGAGNVFAEMQSMHEISKDVFLEVLTSDATNSVGLGK